MRIDQGAAGAGYAASVQQNAAVANAYWFRAPPGWLCGQRAAKRGSRQCVLAQAGWLRGQRAAKRGSRHLGAQQWLEAIWPDENFLVPIPPNNAWPNLWLSQSAAEIALG